jgi:hypothetical protein
MVESLRLGVRFVFGVRVFQFEVFEKTRRSFSKGHRFLVWARLLPLAVAAARPVAALRVAARFATGLRFVFAVDRAGARLIAALLRVFFADFFARLAATALLFLAAAPLGAGAGFLFPFAFALAGL